jgi:hypothetical protein
MSVPNPACYGCFGPGEVITTPTRSSTAIEWKPTVHVVLRRPPIEYSHCLHANLTAMPASGSPGHGRIYLSGAAKDDCLADTGGGWEQGPITPLTIMASTRPSPHRPLFLLVFRPKSAYGPKLARGQIVEQGASQRAISTPPTTAHRLENQDFVDKFARSDGSIQALIANGVREGT